MNPGPAPRPPVDRARPPLPSANSLQGSMSNLNLQPTNSSTTSLVRSRTDFSNSDAIIKESPARVKEDSGSFFKMGWADRYLVLREYQLDFLKNQSSSKVAFSINLRDVTNISRSEVHQYSFEITRTMSATSGASSPRDGPSKATVCKVETENEVYSWIDAIYPKCPGMSGVSNPTNFTHRVHVGFDPSSGAFTGLPPEWERLLNASAITQEDYQRNPDAVVEVLNFFTGKMMNKQDDGLNYPPTPPMESQRTLGYTSSGSSIAPPRPMQRSNTYESARTDSFSPSSDKPYGAQPQPSSADRDRNRLDEERQRRMDDEIRRKKDQERREQERREREELAAYNASLPKSRPPMAQQEVGGGGISNSGSPYADRDRERENPRYNPARAAPNAPAKDPRPNLQASRAAPSPPKANGQSPYTSTSSSLNKSRSPSNTSHIPSSSSNYGQNGSTSSRPANGGTQPAARAAPGPGPGPQIPKPLNVQPKSAAAAKSEAVKKAEASLTRKDDNPGRKEVRMSGMSEAEVMIKLREVVSKERPLDSYNKQKKIGQGASGSVYVARIRENATSPTARKLLRDFGSKAQVAIKQMDLRNQPRKELIVNEIIVMKDSKHENIVNFLDAFLQEEQSELWVVMEFMEGGALTDVIDNNPSISEDQIATVCLEV
jgi:hypothetical protein